MSWDGPPCGCHTGAWWGVLPPPRCPAHENARWDGPVWTGTTTPNFAPPSLADADVERIARRVAELLKGAP